ncbi:condensin-2 complex subunit D3-like [Athalia rosae]|uniref:condensin-2 complex subunit D3-like n=1 Tax=Athalia rosae TaxID=37344 RepID=UPI0020334B96|nr:condensin-2 complex subunit D3-like [Athalia rosae]
MEPLRIFDDFRLDDLTETWISSVWDNAFLTFAELPENYMELIKSEDMNVLLTESTIVVKRWITEYENTSQADSQWKEVSWQTLISLNINPRSLLPVLGYIIKSGQSFDADEDARQSCLKSASLYFTLLSVPASNAFQVFHPNLYHLALNTFKLADHLVERSKKLNRNIDLEDLYNTEDDEDYVLLVSEKSTLIKGLNSLMFNVIIMLKEFYLRDYPRSLEITVHLLLQVGKLSREVVTFDNSSREIEASINSLSYNAYTALNGLCKKKHGCIDTTIKLIAKFLLANLVSNQDELQPKELFVVRESMINFLEKLLKVHKVEARIGISTLIQHLMTKCPDRAEGRMKQALVILRLINSCDQEMYINAIDDLIALTHYDKVGLRIFAQEIIGQLLTENNSTHFLTDESNSMNLQVRKLLLATVLSRCVDSSSLVRGKAMATLADCTNLQNISISRMIRDIFESPFPDKPLPNIKTLQQAIPENIDPLPGSNTIISMLISRVDDERALVRRSALQTLGNLVHYSDGLLNILIPTLGLHCRDPAIVVRRYSIQVFTQLVEKFPSDPLLTQKWVKHVLPQIFDVEVKVQEKVLESLQQLVVNNIKQWDANDSSFVANLPWLILEQITEQKMRKHLAKACAVWVKTDVVLRPQLLMIKSHLGTKNDIPAWVFLSAIAKYKELPDMNHHFDKYRDILCQDTFQANLIVEVLRNSWQNLDRKFLEDLQSDLFQNLCKFQVTFSLISVCCDLLVDVTKYLYPENGDQRLTLSAQNLMKLCEEQLESIMDNEEDLEENLPIYLKAICTLGNASHLCTELISPSTLRTLQGLVIEWKDIPDPVRYPTKLRAAAVTLLGQQAMRDREIAQEILPALGDLMRSSAAPNSNIASAIKVNAAKALADICVRFTALVEPYLPDMCVSMNDPNPMIREAILILLIQLLLEDFIKVKGPFFFNILTMLTDTDEMVRDLTVFLINERLLIKNKTLIFRQFLESIFHYNNHHLPSKFSASRFNHRDIRKLTLPGTHNKEKRKMIYNFMLEHLELPEKLKIIKRLITEIISAVTNGTIDIQKDEGLSVLMDCLYILSSEELQPASCNKRTEEECQNESIITENPLANNAATGIINEMKKQRIEILVPSLVKLKKKLAKTSSPFVKYVARYYLDIVNKYKQEQLESIFNEDPRLETEIQSDQRKYGTESGSEEECDKEPSETPISSPSNLALTCQERLPRIVLRRLSSLTYPGINSWRSPTHSSRFEASSTRFECSSLETPKKFTDNSKVSRKRKAARNLCSQTSSDGSQSPRIDSNEAELTGFGNDLD